MEGIGSLLKVGGGVGWGGGSEMPALGTINKSLNPSFIHVEEMAKMWLLVIWIDQKESFKIVKNMLSHTHNKILK